MAHSITSIVWGNVSAPVTFDFLARPDPCGTLYAYGTAYCLDGCQHTGVDVGMACGTTLYAVAPGIITCAGSGSAPGYDGGGCAAFPDLDCGGGAGRVELLLDDGSVAIYGHCATATLASVGQRVAAGDPIATSGGQNGPHLHFEYRVPNEFAGTTCTSGYAIIDPEPLLTGATAPTERFREGDTVETTDEVNLREGAGTSFPVIATMPVGRNAIVLQGPTVADGFNWYRLETRHGRGWTADEFLERAMFDNQLANPTANENLDYIFPNRNDSSSISRQPVDGNVRVRVENDGVNVGEGVRYESRDPLFTQPGQHFFGGIVHHLKRAPGSIVTLDYVRLTAFYTDGTNQDGGAVGVMLNDTWQRIVLKTLASDPNKTVKKVGLRVTRDTANGSAFSFYSDNARVVLL